MTTPQLSTVIAAIGKGKIWRPTYDQDGNLLAQGAGLAKDGLSQDNDIDFHNKSVADLGCNLGHHSLMAAKQGARLVHGYELDEHLCQGATAIAKMHEITGVEYFQKNFVEEPPIEHYDLVLLIDIIGKNTLAKGRLIPVLDALERYTDQEIIMTIRPHYSLHGLQATTEELADMYGSGHIVHKRFRALRLIVNHLAPRWKVIPMPHSIGTPCKIPVRFVRKK